MPTCFRYSTIRYSYPAVEITHKDGASELWNLYSSKIRLFCCSFETYINICFRLQIFRRSHLPDKLLQCLTGLCRRVFDIPRFTTAQSRVEIKSIPVSENGLEFYFRLRFSRVYRHLHVILHLLPNFVVLVRSAAKLSYIVFLRCRPWSRKFTGATILHGVEFPIFLLIFAFALQHCSANALPVVLCSGVLLFPLAPSLWCFAIAIMKLLAIVSF